MNAARIVVGSMLASFLALHAVGSGGVRIDVLDIGQGDAVLITDGLQQLLVDAGPDGSVVARLGASMPFRDRVIETVVITHPDADHYRGLAWILGRYRIGTLVVATHADEPAYYRELLALAKEHGARVVTVATGDIIRISDRLVADVLWPDAATPRKERNADSVMLRVRDVTVPTDKPALAILTGDAGVAEEAELVRRGGLRAHLLKNGHHGSTTSSSEAFLTAVGGTDAVMSAGEDNRHGHPAPAVVLSTLAAGYRVWRTDLHGTVRAVFRDDTMHVQSCRILCLSWYYSAP